MIHSYLLQNPHYPLLQVHYEKMAHVGAFCSFHTFIGGEKGVGALRYDIGRASNEECMVVGLPFVFAVIATRGEKLATVTAEFPTCRVNGKYGTVTPPGQVSGMLKEKEHFDKVVDYVKKCRAGVVAHCIHAHAGE